MEPPEKCQFIDRATRDAYIIAYRLRRYEQLEAENTKLRAALERRNKDARVLRKLHEEHLAPAINMELIQAEDAADVLLQKS